MSRAVGGFLAVMVLMASAAAPGTADAADKGNQVRRPDVPPKEFARPAEAAQCAWVGRRVLQTLIRDDIIAADEYLLFYRSFGCPVEHLGDAFGCLTSNGVHGEAAELDQAVARCWREPVPAEVPAPAAEAVGGKAASKGGPAAKPADKPADKPAADKPAADKPAEKPADKPAADKPAEKPADKGADKAGDAARKNVAAEPQPALKKP